VLQTFIQKLNWMSETAFMELYSLAACLPGPTSTQVSFALGAVKTGIPGGLLGGALFQLPGLLMMSLLGMGAVSFLESPHLWSKAMVDGAALPSVTFTDGWRTVLHA
jgi:chromate transporter